MNNNAAEQFVKNMLEAYPEANKDVLGFIGQFLYHNRLSDESTELMRLQFRAGYCYYFAEMLKAAFNRGTVCWTAPFGHIVWVDEDGMPYDIEGVNTSDCQYYIPISYIQEGMDDFKHIPGKAFNASQSYINDAIARYERDLKES